MKWFVEPVCISPTLSWGQGDWSLKKHRVTSWIKSNRSRPAGHDIKKFLTVVSPKYTAHYASLVLRRMSLHQNIPTQVKELYFAFTMFGLTSYRRKRPGRADRRSIHNSKIRNSNRAWQGRGAVLQAALRNQNYLFLSTHGVLALVQWKTVRKSQRPIFLSETHESR